MARWRLRTSFSACSLVIVMPSSGSARQAGPDRSLSARRNARPAYRLASPSPCRRSRRSVPGIWLKMWLRRKSLGRSRRPLHASLLPDAVPDDVDLRILVVGNAIAPLPAFLPRLPHVLCCLLLGLSAWKCIHTAVNAQVMLGHAPSQILGYLLDRVAIV